MMVRVWPSQFATRRTRFLVCVGCGLFFFFFQAEDGIRDLTVTGVQTCALPILGAFVGLVTGMAGGTSMHLVRRLNARATHAASERLEAGDTRVLVRLHVAGILRDTPRAALVTALRLPPPQLAPALVPRALTPRARTLLRLAAAGARGA